MPHKYCHSGIKEKERDIGRGSSGEWCCFSDALSSGLSDHGQEAPTPIDSEGKGTAAYHAKSIEFTNRGPRFMFQSYHLSVKLSSATQFL